MRITHVQATVYDVPLPGKEFTDAIHRLSRLEVVVARVGTDEGLEGTGWTYTIGTGGTALKALIEDSLAPLIVGEDPGNVERLWDRMWRAVHGIGSSGATMLAIAAVDIALWDVLGKVRGLPLFRLLGGHSDRSPIYGSGINLYYTMDELLEQMKGFLELKVHGVKIKVGRPDVGEDLERLRAVRDLIGPSMPLMVDANQGWTVGEAINRARAMDEFSLFWLEEPILADDHIGYETLARSVNIPLAAGETHYTRYQFADLMHRRAISFVQADVHRCGGVTEWMKIAKMAEAYNLPMAPHGPDEVHTHLVCAVPNGHIIEHVRGDAGGLGWVANPLKSVDGYFAPHDAPGHGIQLNKELLDRCKVA
jgi:L-alanine-DL-glutamate epimerase-like enolase superfamily enzyme